jgi:hypothetical protein
MRATEAVGWGAAALALLAAVSLSGVAAAEESKAKSTQTEAVWVSYDAAKQEVTARVTKTGKGAEPPKTLEVTKGREATFKVKPTGTVLSRTSVAVNGKKGEITDIPAGKTVNIYWVPDPSDAKARFARKIDVIMSQEEFDEKYGTEGAE